MFAREFADKAADRARDHPRVNGALSRSAFVQFFDDGYQAPGPFKIEYLLRPLRSDINEWALVEQSRVHHALLGQMRDYHVEKLDLLGSRRTIAKEFTEGFSHRMAIKSHQGADEWTQTMRQLRGLFYMRGLADACIEQHLLQLLDIR